MVDDVRLPAAAAPSRVSLFITCFNDTMFPQTGRAVVTVLERLGIAVDFPLEQTCCGQMHFNTGYARRGDPAGAALRATCSPMPRWSSSPSASCVGMVRDYYPRVAALAGDAGLAARGDGALAAGARALRAAGRPARRRGRRRLLPAPGHLSPDAATACGCCRSATAPLRLLRAVGGSTSSSCPRPSECCGFGGTFAVKNADMSIAMLADKVRSVLDTGAEVCVARATTRA